MPKIPSVTLYIRITDNKSRCRYERVKQRNPQTFGHKDSYCLLYYENGRQKWKQVGQDINEALRDQLNKHGELLREANQRSDQPKPSADGPRSFRGASERVCRQREKRAEERPHP